MEHNNATRFTTSQVMKMTGATERQLGYWNKIGLTDPERTGEAASNNRRLYSEHDVARIQDILLLKEFGFKPKDIKSIFMLPEEERIDLLSEQLRERYDDLRHKMLLSSIVEATGFAQLRSNVSLFGSFEALENSYAQDENLERLTRWIKSHTDRDIQHFMAELADVATAFESLGEYAAWSEVEIIITRFCDVWGERFGWPSIGQMLVLHELFADPDAQRTDIGEHLGADTMNFMAELFLLAWTSAGFESLDDVLAFLYKALLDDANKAAEPDDTETSAAHTAAEVLCATICELGGDAHITDWQPSPLRTQSILQLNDAVFELLVDVALDDGTSEYLNIDELATIDAETIDTAQQMIRAYANNELDSWLNPYGIERLRQHARTWYETLMIDWLHQEERAGTNESDLAEAFSDWFETWFAKAYPDAPEATWATEEESCAHERAMRELIEEAEAQSNSTVPSDVLGAQGNAEDHRIRT